MAKKKADLLAEAQERGLEVTEKNTVAQIQAALDSVQADNESTSDDDKETFAKAGKRSAKAVKEAEEEAAKEERKDKVAKGELDPSKEGVKKGPKPKARTKLERRSKKYREAHKQLKDQQYSLKDAVELATKTSTTSFDATVELHFNLNVDPKQADQNVRGNVTLPHGTGKTLRVAVFAPSEEHDRAKQAGADIVGEADFLEQLKKEVLDFDVLIATPQAMAQLGRFAKLLGPKGLMPNPKSGTVTKDVASAVKEAKAGKVEYRVDQYGIVHLAIGKVSFGGDKLLANAQTIVDSVKMSKPPSVKGAYLEKITVTTSMGPGIGVDLSSL